MANVVFGRLVGMKPSDLTGRNIAHILQVDNLDDTIFGQVIREHRTIQSSGHQREPLRSSQLHASPIMQDGDVVGVRLFGTLPTERDAKPPVTRIPMEIAPAFDHLKRFASVAAHEVGNALSTIFATAQLLQSIVPDEPSVNRLAGRIETATKHAMLIMDDLKLLGTPMRQTKVVDINETLQEIAETMNAEALAAGVQITLRLDPNLPAITSDHGRLRQVFTNLVKNGLDAISERNSETTDKTESYGIERQPLCKLIIRSGIRKNGTVEVSFFNHGTPIVPELRERLFEPFFSTKPGGVGLGLSICREIIEGHGGTLDFRSSTRFGTFFRVRLPAYIPQENDGADPTS